MLFIHSKVDSLYIRGQNLMLLREEIYTIEGGYIMVEDVYNYTFEIVTGEPTTGRLNLNDITSCGGVFTVCGAYNLYGCIHE